MNEESLRSLLGRRCQILATFVMIPRVEIVELAEVAGFDAIVLDLEHGPIGPSELPTLTAAARGAGLVSVARLGESRPVQIAAALDAGVDGVMVPHVSSGNAAREVVRAARFPPEGSRSLNPYVRGNGYDGDRPALLEEANERTAVIGMIEGEAGLEDLDGILSAPGLDAAFVGAVDLSAALGVPGQPGHPRVVAEMESVFERVAESGLASGVYAPSSEMADHWLDRGVNLVALSADVAMVLGGFKAVRQRVRRASSERQEARRPTRRS